MSAEGVTESVRTTSDPAFDRVALADATNLDPEADRFSFEFIVPERTSLASSPDENGNDDTLVPFMVPWIPSDRTDEKPRRDAPTIIRVPRQSVDLGRFELHQKWECVVDKVKGKNFTAITRDLSTPGNPDERVTLAFADVNDEDRHLVVAGAVFYWSIGYAVSPAGQRTRSSLIRFRRLLRWTKKDLARIERDSTRLGERLARLEELRKADPF